MKSRAKKRSLRAALPSKRRLLVAGGMTAVVATTAAVGVGAYGENTPESDKAVAVAAAEDHVESGAKHLFATKDDAFERTDTTKTLGMTFSTFERSYRGVPVVGGDVVVATDTSGKVAYSKTGQTEKISLESIEPAIAADEARALAGKNASKAELVVYTGDGADPALAYVSSKETTDDEGKPIGRDYYVDAMTGEKIDTIDTVFSGTGNTYYNGQGGTVDIGTGKKGDGFIMQDPDRRGLSCGPILSPPYTKSEDTWGNGKGDDLETACVDAMYAAAQEGDMLSEWVGRDGIDGQGGYYAMTVGLPYNNAFFFGLGAVFGNSGDGQRTLTTMDIVAHELGHGIFFSTPGSVLGGNETSGLSEGTGDIFGAMTEWYVNQANDDAHDPPDYLVGEEAGVGKPGEPIRNMADPGALDHPACWSEEIPDTEVHAAAGPINHWFYMLAEGTSPGGEGVPGSKACNGATLEGIGIETAGKIFMGALMSKTAFWTYTDARNASLEFAANSDLFDTCAEYDATKAAFDAVDVPGDDDPACKK